MKKSYIFSFLAAGLLLTGCSKENPFDGSSSGEGQVLKSALAMDLQSDDVIRGTRADVNLDDFTVVFTKEGQSAPAAKYQYKDMPDVVTLPAGTYTCTATYGELRDVDWDNPYYLGTSEAFEVNAYEITSYIDPIVCSLQNVKVSIDFDAALVEHMSTDSYVEVKVGSSSSLKFTTAEAAAGKAGYFKHTAECTLVATFNGQIDGSAVSETKSYKDVQKGYHYHVTFKLHGGSASGSGDTDVTVTTDASVTVIGIDADVEVEDDPLLDDNERPREDDPDHPDDPQPGNQAPSIEGQGSINLDGVNVAPSECTILVKSYADGGITGLTCDISSDNEDFDVSDVGLDSHLDLVNPGAMEGPLTSLGFPINVGGESEVEITIAPSFLDMLGIFPGTHTFKLTVTDANGTTVKDLIIKI